MSVTPQPCLTLVQPWAWGIMVGGKDVENRPWRIHRGGPTSPWAYGNLVFPESSRFWIHAGKDWWEDDVDLVRELSDVEMPARRDMVFGAILGSVRLSRIVLDAHKRSSPFASPWAFKGSYHWVVADPRPLPEPIPARGLQKLWDASKYLNGATP